MKKTITLNGFLIARQYSWEDAPTFVWMPYDPTEYDKDCAIVNEQSITVEIPSNFDFRPYRIAQLERQKSDVKKKLAEEIVRLDDEIQKLLSLTHTPEVSE